MNKSFLVYSLFTVLFFASGSVQAENVCHNRAEARRHTAVSQARLAYTNRVRSCRTLASPDRAEQCIQSARNKLESNWQIARARYAADIRACDTES